MKKTLSIALCLLLIFCLVGCGIKNPDSANVSGLAESDMPNEIDHDGTNLINYPRDVKVDGTIIDTAGLIYE